MNIDPTLTPQEQKDIIDLLFLTEGGRKLLAYWEYTHVRSVPFINGEMKQRDIDMMLGKAAFVIDIKNVLDFGVTATEEIHNARLDDDFTYSDN